MFPLRSLCVPKCRFPHSWCWLRHYHGLLTRRFGLFSYIITWNILLYFDLEPLTSPFGSVRLMTQSGPTSTHYFHILLLNINLTHTNYLSLLYTLKGRRFIITHIIYFFKYLCDFTKSFCKYRRIASQFLPWSFSMPCSGQRLLCNAWCRVSTDFCSFYFCFLICWMEDTNFIWIMQVLLRL